jgi:hypothetical protein
MDHLCGLVVRVSGYRSWGPGFYSRSFQIFWEAAGLEQGPLSLVRTTEELPEGKVAAPVYKTEINDLENPLRWPRYALYPQKLALTSPISGGRSVGIVRSRTKGTEFNFFLDLKLKKCTWKYSHSSWTWPFSAECAVDLVESSNWVKDCSVCMG